MGPPEYLSMHSGNSVNYAKFGSAAVLFLVPELVSLKPASKSAYLTLEFKRLQPDTYSKPECTLII